MVTLMQKIINIKIKWKGDKKGLEERERYEGSSECVYLVSIVCRIGK